MDMLAYPHRTPHAIIQVVVSSEWQSNVGAYGVCSYTYSRILSPYHQYYFHCDVKASATRAWIQLYKYSGTFSIDNAVVSNTVADTVYTLSDIVNGDDTIMVDAYTYGTLYSGDYSTISGVTNYWRSLYVYDITELLPFIDMEISRGVATTRKLWCDAKLRLCTDSYDVILYDPTNVATPFVPSSSTSLLVDVAESMSVTGGDVELPSTGDSPYLRTAKVFPIQLAKDSVSLSNQCPLLNASNIRLYNYQSRTSYVLSDENRKCTWTSNSDSDTEWGMALMGGIDLKAGDLVYVRFRYLSPLYISNQYLGFYDSSGTLTTQFPSSIPLSTSETAYSIVVTLNADSTIFECVVDTPNLPSGDVVSLSEMSIIKLNVMTDLGDSLLDILANAGYTTNAQIKTWCDTLTYLTYGTPLVLGKGQNIENRATVASMNSSGAWEDSDRDTTNNSFTLTKGATASATSNVIQNFSSGYDVNNAYFYGSNEARSDTLDFYVKYPEWSNTYPVVDTVAFGYLTTEYVQHSYIRCVAPTGGNNFYYAYGNTTNWVSGVVGYFRNARYINLFNSGLYSWICLNCGNADSANTIAKYVKSWLDTYLKFFTGTQSLESIIYNRFSGRLCMDKSNITVSKGEFSGAEVMDVDGLAQVYGDCGAGAGSTKEQYRHLDPYFDTSLDNQQIYNNGGGGTVTVTREECQSDSPFRAYHGYGLTVVTSGTVSPDAGGVYGEWLSYANAVFLHIVVAKIPVGYTIDRHANGMGTGADSVWLTSRVGTGEFAEYKYITYCGSTGTFSSGGFVSLHGTDNTSVTWYVSAIFELDITGNEYLKAMSVMPRHTEFKDGTVFFSGDFNTNGNLIVNGDGSYGDTRATGGMLLSYDDYPPDDVDGVRCCWTGDGANGMTFRDIPVDLSKAYKLSFWIKKAVATNDNFLSSLRFYSANDSVLFTHDNVMYTPNTRSYLTQDLVAGDTLVHVNSVANYSIDYPYWYVGFRNNTYRCWNTNGKLKITAVDSTNNTLTLATAYTGSTIPKGYTTVNSRDGGNYYYPYSIGKSSTQDWTYVERTFGGITDGREGDWDTSHMFPTETRYMRFLPCIYTSTSDFRIADVRIESIDSDGYSDDVFHLA